MKIVKIAMLLLLASLVPASFAQSASSTIPPIDPNCLDSQEVCQKRAIKREELRQHCIADPLWCEERRAKKKLERDEKRALRQQCKVNPEQCETLKEQFRQRKAQANRERRQKRREQQQKLKKNQTQWCTNNSSDCNRWKADLKVLQKECKKKRTQLQDQYPDRPR